MDMNGDGGFNVMDLIALMNCILGAYCGGRQETPGEGRYAPPAGIPQHIHVGMINKVLNIATQQQALNNPDDKRAVQEIVDYLNSEGIGTTTALIPQDNNNEKQRLIQRIKRKL